MWFHILNCELTPFSSLYANLLFPVLFELQHVYLQKPQCKEVERGAVRWLLQNVFGLSLVPIVQKEVAITPEIQALLDKREQARKAKDWKTADMLREQLRRFGIEVQDKK